jgi:hypothetical protein
MKVKELIEQLQTFDPELVVIQHGYEGGYNEASRVRTIEIALNVNDEWYYGPHEEYREGEHSGFERAKAVELS